MILTTWLVHWTSPYRAWLRLNALQVLACSWPTFLLACLPACLLAFLLTCMPACRLACLHSCMLACMPAHLLACLLPCVHAWFSFLGATTKTMVLQYFWWTLYGFCSHPIFKSKPSNLEFLLLFVAWHECNICGYKHDCWVSLLG